MKDKPSVLWGILPIGSFILMVKSFEIYNFTFIPVMVALTPGLIAGIISTFFLTKMLTRLYPSSNILTQFLYNAVTWGGYVVFFFLWINCTVISKEGKKVEEKIIARGHFAGLRGSSAQPYIDINYNGRVKRIGIYDSRPLNFDNAELEIVGGFFGFEYIRKFRLF